MTIDYNMNCKIDVELQEDYDMDGHPKYVNDTDISYIVKDVEVKDDKVILDVERKYADVTPFEFENPNGETSEVIEKIITWHKLTIAKRDFDKAIQDGDYIKVKIEQSRMYNQELVSAETVSGPKVSDGDVAEIFVVLDEMLEDDTILLLARRQ